MAGLDKNTGPSRSHPRMAKRKDSGQICSLSFLYTYINRNCVQKPPGLKGVAIRKHEKTQ